MTRYRITLATLALLMTIVACASTGEPAARTSMTRISAEELDEMRGQVGNLYEVVARLRPRWFHGDVVVYQNQMLLGEERSLEGLGLDSAYYLTYLDRSQAVAQLPGLGSRHIDGAIVLHTQ